MAWTTLTRVQEFAAYLEIPFGDFQSARRQRSYIYVEADRLTGRKKKLRHLCYPPRTSELRRVQAAIKRKCLEDLPISNAVRGYRKGQHNINCAQQLAGMRYVAKLDVKDFHPSITPELVTAVLRRHRLSQPLCRLITQLATFNRQVPQGAPTSNHIANLVIDFVLAQGILEFCGARGVIVINYGDDTAFGGADQATVDECVEFAKRVFLRNGLETNSKSSNAEHVGAARKFIGTATGRPTVDLPRNRFREYRAELRAALRVERDPNVESRLDKTQMRSFRSKISYVRRINRRKARALSEIFYRLCRIKRRQAQRASHDIESCPIGARGDLAPTQQTGMGTMPLECLIVFQ